MEALGPLEKVQLAVAGDFLRLATPIDLADSWDLVKKTSEEMSRRGWYITVFSFMTATEPDPDDARMIVEFQEKVSAAKFLILFEGWEGERVTLLREGYKQELHI